MSLLTDPGQSDSDQLSVGDLPDKANHLFQAGSSLVSTQLPVGFSQPYSATDFMNSEGSGFGAIYYKGADQNAEVAVAMRREEGLTQDQVDGVVNAYEQEFEKPNETVTGTIVNYYFWEDKPHNQRLMICSVASTKVKSRVDLTIALGDDTPMNKLGMDPVDAKRDRKAVEPAVAPVPG